MLRLSKYELRKNRSTLLILLAGLAALEIFFLVSLSMKKDEYVMTSGGLLILFGVICYFSVFIFAVTNYYREINSKTSYLVFMTPVSYLKIVLSKMLTVLILGVIMAAVLGAAAAADYGLLVNAYGEYVALTQMMNDLLMQWGINAGEILSGILFGIITFLLSFFAIVAIIYLCITLAATLIQNSRFKAVISILFFVIGMVLRNLLQDLVEQVYEISYNGTQTLSELLFQSWPFVLLNLGVLVLCVGITTWMLKKRLSL